MLSMRHFNTVQTGCFLITLLLFNNVIFFTFHFNVFASMVNTVNYYGRTFIFFETFVKSRFD